MKRAIPIEIYKFPLGECTNGGISSRFEDLLLIHPQGYIDIDMDNPPENLVEVAEMSIGDRKYKFIRPVAEPDPHMLGWMDGGNIAHSCDSRFHDFSEYPLCIHDRQETQAEYDALSR